MNPKTYPIAEIFTSVQGEGALVGTLMTFIRLSGCCVGRPYSDDERARLPGLPIYTEKCTIVDGRSFPCDTDYRVHERLASDQIISRIESPHVCITGGEPFIHNLEELIFSIRGHFLSGKQIPHYIQIESSGSVEIPQWFTYVCDHNHSIELWLTISPKKGCREDVVSRAKELKLLVDGNFGFSRLPEFIQKAHCRIFLQPINGENTVDMKNLQLCLDLLKVYPQFRLSSQLHKFIGAR